MPLLCYHTSMNLHFSTGSVVGKKSDTHWAQVLKTSQAFGVVEVRDEEGKAQEKGMHIIRALTEKLDAPDLPLPELFRFVDTLRDTVVRTILLCIPQGDGMTVILYGEGIVYLKRDGQLAKLRSREGTISGKVRSGDMIYLASRTLQYLISEEELVQFFDHLSAEEIAEKLAFHLHEENGSDGYAGLFVEITVDEMPEKKRLFPRPAIQYKKRLFEWSRPVRGAFHKVRSLDARITIVLLLLFAVSIIIGIRNEAQGRSGKEAEKTIIEVQRLYDEGMALIDLNALKSRDRLLEAKTLLLTAQKTISPKTKEGRQLEDLEKKIADALPRATQEYDAQPELFFDVSLLKPNTRVTSWALSDDMMALLDGQSRTLFSLAASSKSGKVVGGGSAFDGASLVGLHGDTAYILVGEGVHALSLKDLSVKQFVVRRAPEWGTIRGFIAFGGNLYLQDVDKSRIWKYVGTQSKEASEAGVIKGFSELREYLNPDTLPDLSKTLNFAIDGSVWLGTSQGQVMKFTQGKDDPFIPKGVEPELGSTLFVYTDDNCDFVYVLDRDNKRVVVFEKNGTYKAQYHIQGDVAPSGLAVSESLKKIFLFIDGKIYAIDLK